MHEKSNQNEVERRSLAVESALVNLIGDLAMRGVVSADEAESVLATIAGSSERSAARAAGVRTLVEQLRKLRRNDGLSAPGAPSFKA
ncbi:hypothetical protein OCK02_03900 (plasmid) [Rhizobium sp. TRM96647]|uniref:hypothetical protein n=1 Tax=unclassified Rhizobium TaxID=2613769 RepID=UPI001E422E48|nr:MULTISPECIES: hypothetical protein [unclassified Rhizobium]MCD2180602.1 hypothetical protein [Rhizobium sp. GN54]MCV3735338.1 hypothetical protein [Rhizobium sp. TRM96647]MCV3757899.1 hypothetical protein [Rhizobium sp. TRM96650]